MHCQAQVGRDNSPGSYIHVRVATNSYSEGLTGAIFVDDCVVHGDADKALTKIKHDWTDEETWALITTCGPCALLPFWENLLNTNGELLRVTSNSTQVR
jgi:hypothetical protein